MHEAVIVEAVRSPIGKGKPGGSLSAVHPADLLAHSLEAVVERAGVEPGLVDDVIAGVVGQIGQQSGDIARTALLAAGYPESVPGTTVDRQCGSSQQAVHFAAQGLLAGAYDVVVAGGVESMSAVPIASAGNGVPDLQGERFAARYPAGLVNQGISAELIAARWQLSRAELDAFAAESHQRAAAAQARGAFDGHIAPIKARQPNGSYALVAHDESIRPGTSVEALAALRPAFYDEAAGVRFPEIDWRVTAGNSSPVNDGSAALLLTTSEKAKELGLRPRARLHSFAVTGSDPLLMLTGVIPATRKVLARAGLTLDDIDLFEVNEAFASVVLSWQRELGVDLAKVNVNGGALALGHPLGASGARIMGTLIDALAERGGRYGLQTMCEGGGMANATIIELL
jgi:acetyl-CoA acyltransferase